MEVKLEPGNMDSDSRVVNITKSVLRIVVPPLSCVTRSNQDKDLINKYEEFNVDDKCQFTKDGGRIHILVSDSDGIVLFDSDRYLQSLSILVYDVDGSLIFSSNEHFLNKNKQCEMAVDFVKERTRKNKSRKSKTMKNNYARNGTDLGEKIGDVTPRETRSSRKKMVVSQSHLVAINRLKDLDEHIKVTAVCSNVGSVGITKDKGEETLNDNISATMKAKDEFPVYVEKDQTKAKISGLTDSKRKTDLSDLIESVTCDICGIKYKSLIMLNRHKTVHEVEHTDAENPLQCSVCKKMYPNWRSLTIHRRKHSATKNNICEKCGKGFRTKQELIRHEFVHSNAKSSPCHICGKLFKNKGYAQMHSKLHSAENRKHVCKLCGKHFLRGPDIQKHMRIHTGEKPFICSQCGRSFSESSHLIRHERLHTGEKPYKCERCDLTFTHKEVLIRHSFSHMEHLPFSCEVCSKGFKTKRELDNHWLVHDKPTDPGLKETCKVCSKVFSHVLYLRYHMRSHNNLGTYECPVCSKVFKKPSYLRQHTINQHGYSELSSDLGLELQTDKVNPDLIVLSGNEVVGSIDSQTDGMSTERYSDVSSAFTQLLLEHENSQVNRDANGTDNSLFV